MEIITKEIIEKAYKIYRSGNSIKATTKLINEKYNIGVYPAAICKRLNNSGFTLRSSKEGTILEKRKHIDISKLLENYRDNRPIREISRNLGVGRRTIQKILRENLVPIRNSRESLLAMHHIKEKQKVLLSNTEKAYLYGLVKGDLTPVRKSDYTLKVITHSTHKYFIDLLYDTFKNYGITTYKETKHNSLRFHSHIDLESFSFLLECKNECLPKWIDAENFFDFLAGFLDSDGSVMLKRSGKSIFYNLRFFGQDLELLNQIKARLKSLGFDSSIHLSHKKGDTHFRNEVMFRYNS